MAERTRPAFLPVGADAASTADVHVIVPGRQWNPHRWRELWRFRELLYFLTWRDVKIRYKQTVLGAAWAILQPALQMVIFTVVFGRFAGLDERTAGIPYPVYVYAALVPWTFFANAVIQSSNSMLNSAHLITKVYFPRLIIPIAAVGANIIDLLIAGAILIAMLFVYDMPVSPMLLLAPLFLAGILFAAIGVGTLMSALIVAYRDFRYVVPFMVQIWMFLTPVIYPVSIVPERWRWVATLNPMAGLIDAFRSAALAQAVAWESVTGAVGLSLVVFAGAAAYFRRVERRFADVI